MVFMLMHESEFCSSRSMNALELGALRNMLIKVPTFDQKLQECDERALRKATCRDKDR